MKEESTLRNQNLTAYEALGGAERLRDLVEAFYDRVEAHPNLRPLFPEDMTATREKQYRFLTQFFGGPSLYSEKHGPPMMRGRHLPFPITEERAHEWLSCMNGAMDEVGLEGPVREYAFDRLRRTALHFVNMDTEGHPIQ